MTSCVCLGRFRASDPQHFVAMARNPNTLSLKPEANLATTRTAFQSSGPPQGSQVFGFWFLVGAYLGPEKGKTGHSIAPRVRGPEMS